MNKKIVIALNIIFMLLTFVSRAQIDKKGESINIDSLKKMRSYYFSNKVREFDSAYVVASSILKIEEEKYGKDTNYCDNLLFLALICEYQKKLRESILFLKDQLNCVKGLKGESHPDYSSNMNYLSNLYSDNNEYDLANSLFNQTLRIKRKYQQDIEYDYIETLLDFADLKRRNNEFDTATVLFNEALKINSKILTTKDEEYTKALMSYAHFNLDLNNLKEAESKFSEVLKIKQENYGSTNVKCVNAMNGLAVVYHNLGNYTQAEKIQLQVKEIIEKSYGKKHPWYSASLNNLSQTYEDMGRFLDAEKYCLEGLNLRKDNYGTNNLDYSTSLAVLGGIYRKQKKYAESEKAYKESTLIIANKSGLNNPNYASSLGNLALLYEEMNKLDSAEILLKQALAVNKNIFGSKSLKYSISLANLAGLYDKKKDYLDAFPLLQEAAQIKINNTISNFLFLSSKEKEESWQSKIGFYKNMLTFSSKTYSSIKETSQFAYNINLFSNCLILESSVEINKSLSSSSNLDTKSTFSSLKMKQKELSNIMSQGKRDSVYINILSHVVDSLDQLLSRKMSSYANYKKNFSLTWKEVQSNLSNEEASIEFARYYDDLDSSFHYMALILKQGDKYPTLINLCFENELQQLSPEKELNELYSLLWKPISSQLSGIKTIYYAPAGLMNNIPFQALYENKDGKREYLMDKYSMHQLTSSRYLALGLKKKSQELIKNDIALFGGVNYNDLPEAKLDTSNYLTSESAYLFKNSITNRDLEDTRSGASYLPGTKREVEDIAELLKLKKWTVTLSEGKNASENKMKSFEVNNSKSILHIATHGFAFSDKVENKKNESYTIQMGKEKYKISDNPMIRCGLLFSGANLTWQGHGDSLLKITNEDAVLTAYELSQLDLSNTKLVVLSACETGKGAIQGSEGTFGLKRALKLAGVDNMIVSLWKVPDDATMEMMTLFYTELAKTKLPVQAFELAQKTMRNNYPNEPKKWAGFVFVR